MTAPSAEPAEQLTLPEFAEPESPGSAATLDEQFAAWIAVNDWIVELFIRLARESIADGAQRVSAKHLVEVMRYQHRRAIGADRWALNNNYTSRLARLAMQRAPDLAEVIQTRRLRS